MKAARGPHGPVRLAHGRYGCAGCDGTGRRLWAFAHPHRDDWVWYGIIAAVALIILAGPAIAGAVR